MRTAFLWAAAVLALVILVLVRWQPEALSLLRPCPFLALTGAACPTCGTTHAAKALSHGRLTEAFVANPLAAAALLLLLPAAVASVVLRRIETPPHAQRILAWCGATLVLLNWGYLLVR
jgi:hypothetical protein